MDQQHLEQPNVELPRDYSPINALPAELFCTIMQLLQLWEQISLRRVCHHWQNEIEKKLEQVQIGSLKLNVTKAGEHELKSKPHSWQPKACLRRMQFEFVYKEPELVPSKRAQITISEKALNSDAICAIGRMFAHIRALVIYWDTEDSQENIDKLVVLLSQEFSSLTSFGLIVSGEMTNREALPEICSTIEAHFKQLKQLHLMDPGCYQVTYPQFTGTFPGWHTRLPLDKALKSVTCFSLNQTMHHVSSMLPDMPDILAKFESGQLDTLAIHPVVNIIMRLVDITRCKSELMIRLASVRRLQLLSTEEREDVEKWLEFCPNVEQLHLTHSYADNHMHPKVDFLPWNVKFDFHWIRTLKRFTKLTELTLYNFKLEFMAQRGAREVEYFDGPVERFDQLRKLTVASADLFYHFQMAKCAPFLPGLKVHHLGNTIGIRFPGLRELNLWSGDSYLNKTADSSWQVVERNINRELPAILPQMPELRVNVQLRHPVMYNLYLSLPAQYRRQRIDNIATLNADRMNVCNQLIRHMSEREYDADYVTSLLNGNINTKQDAETVLILTQEYRNLSNRVVR